MRNMHSSLVKVIGPSAYYWEDMSKYVVVPVRDSLGVKTDKTKRVHPIYTDNPLYRNNDRLRGTESDVQTISTARWIVTLSKKPRTVLKHVKGGTARINRITEWTDAENAWTNPNEPSYRAARAMFNRDTEGALKLIMGQ